MCFFTLDSKSGSEKSVLKINLIIDRPKCKSQALDKFRIFILIYNRDIIHVWNSD